MYCLLRSLAKNAATQGRNHYVGHPLLPLNSTVVNVNLEQLGRSDSSEGENRDSAFMTAFAYSDLAEWFDSPSKLTGVKLKEHPRFSNPYFKLWTCPQF